METKINDLVFMILKRNMEHIQASNSCLSNYWQPSDKMDEIHFYDPYYNYTILYSDGSIKQMKREEVSGINKNNWCVIIPTKKAKTMMKRNNVYSLIESECLKGKMWCAEDGCCFYNSVTDKCNRISENGDKGICWMEKSEGEY